jgi:hypothetical protein
LLSVKEYELMTKRLRITVRVKVNFIINIII